MNMPVLDGWGFAEQAKARGFELPILVVTATREHAARAAREIRADRYLSKPFQLIEFLDVVETLALHEALILLGEDEPRRVCAVGPNPLEATSPDESLPGYTLPFRRSLDDAVTAGDARPGHRTADRGGRREIELGHGAVYAYVRLDKTRLRERTRSIYRLTGGQRRWCAGRKNKQHRCE